MQNESMLDEAINRAMRHGQFYCKFLALNDCGLKRNSHQEGIYISVHAAPLFLKERGRLGENMDGYINVHVQEGMPPIRARFVWYGAKKREYRITQFWTNSPWDKKQQLGNLFVLIKLDDGEFFGYIFDKEEEIETFLDYFNISLIKNSAVYGVDDEEDEVVKVNKLQRAILDYAHDCDDFPLSSEISETAREFFFRILKNQDWHPDRDLLKWIEIEYRIFNEIEKHIYSPYLTSPFGELDRLVEFANMALNRRKSRAGKSLEHHVDFVLRELQFPFDHPGRTEGNRKPDFLFPSNKYYKDADKFDEYLVILGAKTTCKDRWRQLVTEGNKVEIKHLITLQQGITTNQLDEMIEEKVQLVVPRPLHSCYPEDYQDYLWDVNTFIGFLMEKYR